MTVHEATLILRRRPQDDAERRVSHAALLVLGHEAVDHDVIERDIMRPLTPRERDVLYSAAAWRAA